ncbi:MAG: hypothetical protein QNJ70_30755 [Xenococcaceae cyanobacterium MO_207.B15]|nr:hypothetical protein [Xenococcaceae cyanobacterium MO_207.B15]
MVQLSLHENHYHRRFLASVVKKSPDQMGGITAEGELALTNSAQEQH